MSIFILVLGLILFIGLVVIHEWGHFVTARRNGVEAEEFGIFFPPSLYKHRTKQGWIFSINLLPLGGFVKLKGEHDSDTERGSFGAASIWVKTKIMSAGVFMNLLTAVVLLTILAIIGMPKIIPNQYSYKGDTKILSQKTLVGDIEKDSPGAKAGLKKQDIITSISNGKNTLQIAGSGSLKNATRKFAGDKVKINYIRGGQQAVTYATLLTPRVVSDSISRSNYQLAHAKTDCTIVASPKGYLGVTPTDYTLQRSTWSAPITAVGLSAQVTTLTFKGLGSALSGLGKLIAGAITGNTVARSNGQCAATSQVAGPVGIFVILKEGSHLGLQFMLFIIAIISLTLAIMNILPIPALDGGRLWIMLFTRAIGKPLNSNIEELINAVGFFVLIGLVILITIVDVKRF